MRTFRHLLFVALAAVPAAAQWHVLDIWPRAGLRGEIRMHDDDRSNYMSWQAAPNLTATFAIIGPTGLPPATRCLQLTVTGQLEYAADVCGTGSGGGFYQTMRDGGFAETQRGALNFVSQTFILNDDAGGDETEVTLTSSPADSLTLVGTLRSIATSSPLTGGGNLSANRTLACATCVTTNTAQTITGIKEFDVQQRFDGGLAIRNSFGVTAGLFESVVSNTLVLRNSTGGILWSLFSGVSPAQWTIGASLFPNGTGHDIGGSGAQWDDGWFTGTLTTDLLQVDETSTFTLAATFNGGLATGSATNSTLYVNSGNFYARETGGLSTAISCSGVDDGWTAFTSDDYLVRCDGGGRFRVALVSF